MKNIIYFLVAISLFSCLKEEEPLARVERGGTQIGGVDIDNNADYANQMLSTTNCSRSIITPFLICNIVLSEVWIAKVECI